MEHRLIGYPFSRGFFHKRLFLSQCINHAAAIILTLLWVTLALAIGAEKNLLMNEIAQIGLASGIAFIAVLFFAGLLVRGIGILFFGTTLGFWLMKLEPANEAFSLKSWAGITFESLQLPFLGFWVVEWILRIQGRSLWNDLNFDKSSITL